MIAAIRNQRVAASGNPIAGVSCEMPCANAHTAPAYNAAARSTLRRLSSVNGFDGGLLTLFPDVFVRIVATGAIGRAVTIPQHGQAQLPHDRAELRRAPQISANPNAM